MRKTMIFGLCFLISTLLLVFITPQAALASGWEWRQDDWSGGPGQTNWLDDARYDSSITVDTMSVPGTLRLTFIPNYFAKELTNPVIDFGAAGTWDSQAIWGFPSPREEGGYDVLYRGRDAGNTFAVGYASSNDGVAWNKDAGNPVLQRLGTTPSWDQNGVQAGPLLTEGQENTLYYYGYDAAALVRYGRATSQDLTSWQRDGNFVFAPGPAGSWDERLSYSYIEHEGPIYRMWYFATDATSAGQVGYAFSNDGITWNREATNPILTLGTGGSWDDGSITGFKILRRPWIGDYLIVYSARNAANVHGIGIATSPDGITWTKHAGNPVYVSAGPGAWDQSSLLATDVNYDGSLYDVTLVGADAASIASVGDIYSFDGLIWLPNPANPTLPYSPAVSWDDAGIIATSPFLEGNNLRIFYNGISFTAPAFRVGTATCTPHYAGVGTLISSVFDTGSTAQWGNISWQETVPAGCAANVQVRTGNVPTPDATWTGWAVVTNGAAIPNPDARYIQYTVTLTGPGNVTPEVSDIVIDFESIPTTWYFAEGYTGPGFDEWISIQNPNPAAANIQVIYYTPGGAPVVQNHTADPQSRLSIYVNEDLGPNLENSFMITSSQQVIVERPMYFRYTGTGNHSWEGGHDAMGSTTLSRHWYFAEGYTGAGEFEEWLTVQNPNTEWATLDVTYFVNGAAPIRRQHRVAPTSRYTVDVNQDAGPNLEISVEIESNQPVLAERPMYFNYQGSMYGGHIVMGSPYLAQDWYLAEGATFSPFTEYVTVQNPNPVAANLIVTYFRSGEAPIVRNHTVDPNSRYTINAGVDSGVAGELSTYVNSSHPVLVERPMYFNMLGGALPGGHCAMGVNSPSTSWYFGEGYTGPGFDEWLTVQNPNAVPANLQVTYYIEGQPPEVRNHVVEPQSRYTIDVNVDAGEDLQLSTYILSDQAVICERPMYFFYQGYHSYDWPGGHDSQGFAP